MLADAMTNSILDECLKNQVWNCAIEYALIDLCLCCEPVTIANALDAEVPVEDRYFLAQRYLLKVCVVEHGSEETAKTQKEILCRVDIFMQKRSDRVQRVEEKVRMKMGLKDGEPSLGEFALQACAAHFFFTRVVVVVPEMHEAYQNPIHQEVKGDVHRDALLERIAETWMVGLGPVAQRGHDEQRECVEYDANEELKGENARPVRSLEAVAKGEPDSDGRKDCARVPDFEFYEEVGSQRPLTRIDPVPKIGLTGEQSGHECPDRHVTQPGNYLVVQNERWCAALVNGGNQGVIRDYYFQITPRWLVCVPGHRSNERRLTAICHALGTIRPNSMDEIFRCA